MSWSEATGVLKRGGVVIFPTETAYGIGCRIDNQEAVRRLVKIRGREKEKPFLVLVDSLEMAKKYLQDLPIKVETLAKKFWPGPLTIVYFACKERVSFDVRGGGETLGVRMPDYDLVLKLVGGVGVPILAPSANFAGGIAPFKLSELNPELVKLVDFTIKEPCGGYKLASTVIDCTKKPWEIIREGAVRISNF